MAAATAVKKATDMGLPVTTTKIECDNQATISLLKNPVVSARSKHIEVLHHFARDNVARHEGGFVYVRTDSNVADSLTKPLHDSKLTASIKGMGMRSWPQHAWKCWHTGCAQVRAASAS
jgi:hypothetical protein